MGPLGGVLARGREFDRFWDPFWEPKGFPKGTQNRGQVAPKSTKILVLFCFSTAKIAEICDDAEKADTCMKVGLKKIFIGTIKREKNEFTTLKALFDLGASSTLVSQAAVKHLKNTVTKETVFSTAARNFSTQGKCRVKMKFPEFNPTAEITKLLHMAKTLGNYNVIIGRELLHKLGFDISFSQKTMTWNDVTIDMKPPTCTKEDYFHVEEELFVSDETDQIAKILDAKYKPANLKEITDILSQLTNNQKEQLQTLLEKQNKLFDGTLGLWKGSLYKIELREGAKPHHARPYGILHAYVQMFKQEVERLCQVGMLRKINRSK